MLFHGGDNVSVGMDGETLQHTQVTLVLMSALFGTAGHF